MADAYSLPAAILEALLEGVTCADDGPAAAARHFLDAITGASDAGLDEPFASLIAPVREELAAFSGPEGPLRELTDRLEGGESLAERPELLWRIFFPEALYLADDPSEQIDKLRDLRTLTMVTPAEDPIVEPGREILFTSNALLSPPSDGEEYARLDSALRDAVRTAAAEEQEFWYDHPVPVGVAPEANEILYGLKGLAGAAAFERQRGTLAPGDSLTVALSVSVTHAGLRAPAAEWLRTVLSEAEPGSLDGLVVYGFTEEDTAGIIEILAPLSDNPADVEALYEVFGVDGEYGRHYSFLKALPALLKVLADPGLKATFKIDLDQIFPQPELAGSVGKSALELLSTPWWGGAGLDRAGNRVELGMIAGALVNEKDIGKGLFTPDIPWPQELPVGEDLFFFKLRPMAVSTRAEMMTRYGEPGMPDGREELLQRVHVTGGTNGIRIDALRRHRPFTPGFIGRAEDQAYLLSTIGGGDGTGGLAYLHQPGLIMRHDKEAFAAGAVKAGKAGSYVGDLIRTLVFSDYASFLPGGRERVKALADPFTGCFITPVPFTSVALRLALHLIDADRGDTAARGAILELAARRVPRETRRRRGPEGELAERFRRERAAWELFYGLLDRLEGQVPEGVRERFGALLSRCRLFG